MKKHLLWLVLMGCPWAAWAGTTAGSFAVKLELHYREKCLSETLSAQTNAMVQVVCRSGHFVSIDPMPGKPFLGTHGGAFRFHFGGGGWASGASTGSVDGFPLVGANGQASPDVGYGTVTGLRVFNPYGVEDPFEFLISF